MTPLARFERGEGTAEVLVAVAPWVIARATGLAVVHPDLGGSGRPPTGGGLLARLRGATPLLAYQVLFG